MPLAPRVAVRALPALALLLLIPASASASGAVRYASVDGTSLSCTSAAPCSLEVAVADASAGDEVVVTPGTYAVTSSLSPLVALDIHGVAGRPRPWIVGSDSMLGAVLSAKQGGTLRHLGLKAISPTGDGLTLQRGTGEDLLIFSEDQGDGGKIVGSANGTVLRDSVVHANGSNADVAGLKLRESGGAGDVHLVNVTVMAPSATGIRCDVTGGQATLVNTIVHGATADVDATHAKAGHCVASTSNFRPSMVPGLASGAGNQDAAPLFVDAASGDYRVRDGSPTDDAGAVDPLLGATDPAGCPRTLGLGPDIGAFEHADPMTDGCANAAPEPMLHTPVVVPGAAPGGGSGDDDADGDGDQNVSVPAPVLGQSVVIAAPGKGTLKVRTPGSKHFRTVDAATHIPIGSVIDATEGRARLTSALDSAGRVQSASFWGSRFLIRQPGGASGRVDLYLRGALDCSTAGAASTPGAASTAAVRKKPRRSLWGKDRHGRYRTHGQSSAATARGTRWVTSDTCAGTRTRVVEGAVAVRDFVHHRTVIVRAGHSILVRKKHR